MPLRRVTLQDVAARIGVDPSTVSLALRGSPKLPEETRERITRVAKGMGYRPNILARGLSGYRTNTIGVLIPWLHDEHFSEAFDVQERWMRSQGYFSILAMGHPDTSDEPHAIESLIDRGIDALLCNYVPFSKEAMHMITEHAERGLPVVVVGHHDLKSLDSIDRIEFNIASQSCEMTRYLLGLGHRRIALVRGLASGADAREEGYTQALKEAAIPVDPDLIVCFDQGQHNADYVRKEIMAQKAHPTAIFAYNDDLANELIVDLQSAGYHVPHDVSVAGINDGWIASACRVPLTTIHQPAQEMAEVAAQMLLERVSDPSIEPRHRLFDGHIVVRESTAPPHKA